mmetsp:Transcript_25453/g.39102  ORF Transcript_25453/g.39102 Transcript_25453/m.39102 type:complete len:388 (-) Transcript_25453:78-1241(-)
MIHNDSNNNEDEGPPLVTEAYVCHEKGAKLVLEEITLPSLTATQVEVDITHCGLCHTDIHMRDNDWGSTDYPIVLGHEGVGIIRKIGSSVKTLKIGDRVGVFWIRDSCQCCDPCLAGRENICEEGYQGLYLGASAGCWGKNPHNEHGGCFSKVVRIEAKFAIKLPESLPSEVASPFVCGGGTLFEPVSDYVKTGTRVAIASIGGLGTAGIKFSKSFGGHVTALSRSEEKREKALGAGADEFFACLGNADAMAELTGKFDLIIDTSPQNSDVASFMGMLKFGGTYCRVGIPPANDMDFTFSYIPLIFTKKKIAGSVVTGTRRMKQMLQLVTDELKDYGSDPKSWNAKVVSFEEVNDVMDDLLKGRNTNNWRYVFTWGSKGKKDSSVSQ